MRLSKTSLIFLGIGVFVILVAGLGLTYSQRRQEQNRLKTEVELAQLRLEQYPAEELASQKEELESRLTRAELQYKVAKASLRALSPENIEATDALFVIAQNTNVEVTEISSDGLVTEPIEGIGFTALPLTVTIEGDVLNLIDFVYRWNDEYATGKRLRND